MNPDPIWLPGAFDYTSVPPARKRIVRCHGATRRSSLFIAFTAVSIKALLEESALHGVPGERECCSKVLASGLAAPASKLELAKRCEVERIGGEPADVTNRADLFEPAVGTFVLRDRDGAVERDNRGRMDRHQRVVECNDAFPIRI